MLISTWIRSFRNRLQGHARRPNRRSPEHASRTLEHLESRHLLSAPSLLDVQDQGGRVIPQGGEIQNSPTALVVAFDSTPDLDATTITNITLERAGQDGAFDGTDVQIPVTVSIAGTSPNTVLLSLGQSVPSDLYRINLPGALANTDGEQFNAGADSTFDFSIQLPPPTLVAVRPNVGEFLQDGETRNVAPNELTLQFNPGQIFDPFTISTQTIQVERSGYDGTFGDGNEELVDIGYVGIGDVPEEIVIRFGENLDDDSYQILLDGTSANPIKSTSGEVLNNGEDTQFNFSLDLGARVIAVDPQPVTRDENTNVLTQARDQIVLYFNNDDLLDVSAQDASFYQLIFTNDTITNLDDNNLDGDSLTPPETINPLTAVYDSTADTVTLTFADDIENLAGAGTYRLRVGTDESIPVPPTPRSFGILQDPGDSFDSATIGNLGDLNAVGSQIVSSAIDPKVFPFDFPGGNDEPGSREIEIETHLLDAADSEAGITQIDYNFQDAYGFDPAGNILINTITEAQKQRAREVFEYYSTILGIDFRETTNDGFIIATGDLRALDPLVPTGPGGVTGIAGGGVAIMDQAEVWDDAPGSNWFQTAMHEIGHLLGIGHAADLPPVTVNSGDGFGNTNAGAFNGFAEPVFPGDHDIVHGQYLHRPESTDIDLYQFDVTSTGLFTAEVMAERLSNSSLLDSQLRLFQELPDGSRELMAQNDDYFSEDSYLELALTPGRYFIGISSSGNDAYDPTVPNTGFGGTSQGDYDLRINFRPDVTNPANVLVDRTGAVFDGDSDGLSGGIYDFWFRATDVSDTLIVDKEAADKDTVGRANNGTLDSPFLEIDLAFAAATAGQTVRIVGNGGADNDVATVADNSPYQIGLADSGQPLADGGTFTVPKGVSVQIDGGAIIKLRQQSIGVGSTTAGVDLSGGSLQVLGTPGNEVILTSWFDETVGTDTTSTPTSPAAGNWGGIAIRNDVDESEGRFTYRSEGIFLNYIGHTTIQYGGGNVIVDGKLQTVNPIHITSAQPTIVHNTITDSLDSAISADPDSFEEITFHAPKFQAGAPAFTNDYTRVGPDIHWNTLVNNSTNGLFIRVQTGPGEPIQKLTVPGRFDDTDIVHVITQNLEIQGTPGGPILDESPADATLVVVTPTFVSGNSLPLGTYNYRITFIDANGFESPTSNRTATAGLVGSSNSVLITSLPAAPAEYVGRRIYRSDATGTGTYTLIGQLGRSETAFLDDGTDKARVLDTSIASRNRPRFDARLSIDPGVVVKLEGSRIEAELGAQFIAEGAAGREIIFTSRLDDRFGAGGTFDTNNDGDLVSPQAVFLTDNFESGGFDSSIWDTAATTATLDALGLAETSGSQSAHLAAGQRFTSLALDLNGQPAVDLQYSFQRTGSGTAPGNTGDLRFEYRDNVGTWRVLDTQAGNGADMTSFQTVSVRVPAGAIHFNSAFRVINTSATGDWFVDDFRIVESRTDNIPSAGNWGGIYIGHLGSASIDQALVTYGGGIIPVENDFSGFNAIEIHQAEARITNTVFEQNASGSGGSAPSDRFGLFSNSAGTIFVRGAQPVILDNEFRANSGPVISINANALNSTLVSDPGRSTGLADQNVEVLANQGPLIENNRLGGNGINGMVVRPATLTTQSVWDDTDIVHVLQNEILIPDLHTYGGLRLESRANSSLVVKLQGANAGFTANGYPIDIDDRIGGSLQIYGQPGQPVVLTSISDDSVGAGFDLRGLPLRDTNGDGASTGSAGDWRGVRIAEYANDRNVAVYVENEVADANSADVNFSVANSEDLGLLAGNVKSGDENLRLGFEIHGAIDANDDQDVYGFEAEAGTHVWLDIDRTSVGLDSVIELLDSSGNILAQSDNSLDELNGEYEIFTSAGTQALPLNYSQFHDDLYTLNAGDAGMRITLPGAVGDRQSYFVRVRSSNLNASFEPTQLFFEDFEAGTFLAQNWSDVQDAEISVDGIGEPSGVLSARINNNPSGDQIESVAINLSAQQDVQLTYSFQRTGGGDSPEVGEDLIISYRLASGAWTELDRQLGAGVDMDTFESTTVDLPATALHSNFALRFSTTSTSGGTTDDWFVDDILLESLPAVNRKSLQSNASVGDGKTSGVYQLQVRLQNIDEFAGTQITRADVRFAATGIEVLGQPTHSLLTGEAAEGVTVLPNVLNTDRGAISISGNLANPNGTEVDFYEFEVFYDVTQQIAGDGDDSAHVPVVFDVDYASGFSRANTTIAVFNSDNELILIGRDSNISDDQAKALDSADVDDTSRGSVGKTDSFIGPAELISGTYFLAVFSNEQLPTVLDQYYQENSTNGLVRLEPINSTQRIAEERFDNPFFTFDPVTFEPVPFDFSVTTALPPVTDLFTTSGGTLDPKHVVPFTLGDVTLFVTTDGGTKNGDKTALYTVDPFTGAQETVVGGYNHATGDIAVRADGQLHALTVQAPGNTASNDGTIGRYLTVDTGTAAIQDRGGAGITTNLLNPAGNGSLAHNAGTVFEAFAYSGTDAGNNESDVWAVGSRRTNFPIGNQMGFVGAEYTSNILYNLNLASGGVDSRFTNPRTGNGGFNASDGAGTSQWEHGYVDTTFDNGGLQGIVTGIVTMDGGFSFYAVDDAGGLYLVNRFGGQTSTSLRSTDEFFNDISTTFIRNIGADENGVGGLNLDFQGLALGPENVENGLLSQTLFGITSNGDIYAFELDGSLAPVFVDGQSVISTGLFNANGLDFGTLDYNLWHTTTRRGGASAADDGHGVDVETFDNSVVLPETGGRSLFFGFEGGANTPDPSFGGNQESGNKNTAGNNSINNAAVANIDFPGGAHGSVVSNEFSLEGYSANDKPTLYFSYFLDTEGTDFDPSTNPDILMRDSFRVFVQDETGQWRLVTTNNSYQDSLRLDEFDIGHDEIFSDGLSNNPSQQTFADVEEAFDNTGGWRQARIDLSNYAGLGGLKLRFDFSTAGSMNLGDIQTTGSELFAVPATELTDGQIIVLGDGFGSTTFEFDLGAHLTLPSGNAAIGQSFTVVGPDYNSTFTFTDAPVNATDIPAFASDSAAELADRTANFVNAFFNGIRISVPAAPGLENESFRFQGEIFTFTANPLRAQDILAELGDTAETIAARTVTVVNSTLGAGTAFADGAEIDLYRGTSLDFGGTLNITSAFGLQGESFTVNQQTFTFVDVPVLATDVGVGGLTTTAEVATAAANVINTVLGAGTAFVFPDAPGVPGAPSRISVPDIQTTADRFITGGTLIIPDVDTPSDFELENFTLFDQTFTLTATPDPARLSDVLAEAGDSGATVAARIRTAIENLFGQGTVLAENPLVPERISIPNISSFTDSFTQGSTLVIQNVADLLNYEFEINFQTFRFTDNPTRTGDILTRVLDSPEAVAQEAVRIINSVLGFQFANQDLERVVLPSLSSTFAGVFQGSRLNFAAATPRNIEGDSFTIFETTYTFTTTPGFFSQIPDNAVEIDYTGATTAEDIARIATAAINTKLASDSLAPRANVVSQPAGEIIGIDFDPGLTSPTNWNQSDDDGAAGFFSLSNLMDETGGSTPVDLFVAYGTAGLGTVANMPTAADIPTHTNDLSEIGGAITDNTQLQFSFSGLTALADYELHIVGGDVATTGSQEVFIFDDNGTTTFTQAWTNSLVVNDQPSSNANLDTFTVTATADQFGRITILVNESTAADDVVIPAIALRQLATPPVQVEIAGAVQTELGTSFELFGPDAAATNGDSFTIDQVFPNVTFTYQANAGNAVQIQSDNNEFITADRTVIQVNSNFANSFNSLIDAFETGRRVNLPSFSDITYNDSGSNGSIIVSDHARLSIGFGDNVDGDVLTVAGVDLTFVDTATPVSGEIGSNGFGTWTAADIVAAINVAIPAINVVTANFNNVLFLEDPQSSPLITLQDPGNDGLTIIDDGTSGNPFAFTTIGRPTGVLIDSDLPGTPLTSDNLGTTLVHDGSNSPITRLLGGPAKATDNRITFRSASSLTSPGSTLRTEGADGTATASSGPAFQIVASTAQQLDLDTITVPSPLSGFPTTFTYVTGTPQSTLEIQASANAGVTAARTKQVVESFFGQSNVLILNGTVLTLGSSGQVSYTDSFVADGGIAFPGTPTLPAINIDAEMDANEVALAIRQALADVYSNSDVNNIKGHEELIRIIGHTIIDDGPLKSASALPGDEFGAFNAGYEDNNRTLRPGSLRGMDNAIEGVYIDDIIIGFAERGEMVTNAAAGQSFIANPDVDDSASSELPNFNQNFTPNVNQDIVNGRYDVEIRRGSDYGFSQTANPTNILYRALDTNDREGRGISVSVPDATVIPDRSTFTVSNGINSVTFQFVDSRSSTLAPDPGLSRILYDPLDGTDGEFQDNRELMARLIVNAINADGAQDALSPANLTDEFGVQALYSDTEGNTSSTIHLTGNATLTPDPVLAGIFQIQAYNFTGDSNRLREQGQIVIQSSFVTDSAGFGILVDEGASTDGLSHPGAVRTTQEVNTQSLAPGVVISNNVVANNASGGIRYSGDPSVNGIASVGRIVNNTIVGTGSGTGVLVDQGASPTLLNNIVSSFGVGINANGGNVVIGSTLYHDNGNNSNAGLGTFPIVLVAGDPLFVNAAEGNYYPAPGSQAIDSSLESLADNPELVRIKTPLGAGLSPLVAPEVDVFGQVRGDDDSVSTPSSQGGNVFLDRGAIDRVDFFQPVATLSNPEDGAANDLDPDPSRVWAVIDADLRQFRLRLDDQGIGIDDSGITTQQFTLQQDDVDLIEGVHYIWSYNSVTNEVQFTAVTTFPLERRYSIIIENQPFNPTVAGSIDGVRDLAGNYLNANQTDGATRFEILLTDGLNDPPEVNVPPIRARIDEDTSLTFSPSNSNALTISDADVHLAPLPELNVTISSTFGSLTLGSTQGLSFAVGTGISETTMSFRGTVTDINLALDGLTYVPDQDYSNLLSGEAASNNPAEITFTVDDGDLSNPPVGQFAAADSAVETTIVVVPVDVVAVNDPPSFTPPSVPPAIEEDSPAVSIPGFITGLNAGPAPSETGQTFVFNVQAPVTTAGNLQFSQAPAISPTGDLTYEVAGDTNGTAEFVFTLTDANPGDPNHVPATSAPVTVTIVVNPVNDEPLLTTLTTSIAGVEDEGLRTSIPLVSSAAAGPATATDELASQTLTFMASAPTVATGNLTFTSFSVSPTTGELSFEAAPNSSGSATFNLWVEDSGPSTGTLDDNASAPETITISVTAVGDPPVPVTPNYTIDEGDTLRLDASGSSDPDIAFPGDTLTYSWDLNNDGNFTELMNESNSIIDVPYSTLAGLNLTAPGDNPITLRVTDTFEGTSVDTTATLTILTVDYGDAPDTFGTLKASNGAAHTIIPGFFLGTSVDSETDGQADDGADEDGITFEAGIQADDTLTLDSFFRATASTDGKLDIWVDFNNSGTFEVDEHLNSGTSYDLVVGLNQFDFTIAGGRATLDEDLAVRARFSSTGGLTPNGRAADGEVEDHTVVFSALLDAIGVEQVLPAHGDTSDSTPTIQWQPATGSSPGANASYNIELQNANGDTVGFEEDFSGESITISDPLPPGVYNVFITSFNRAGVPFNMISTLTFEVVAISVTSPSGTIQDNTPTITWTPVSDLTDHYEVQIRSGLTGNQVFEDLNVTGTSLELSDDDVLAIGSYQVRVRAIEDTTGQIGDWSAFQNFHVGTSPALTAPVPATGQTSAIMSVGNPTISWTDVPGAATYEVIINDVTDNISPLQTLTGLIGNSIDLVTPLDLGEYTIQVRGITADAEMGEFSPAATLRVEPPTTITQPTERLADSTPTIVWTAVPGAEEYGLSIIRTVDNVEEVVYPQSPETEVTVTGTQFTVPDADQLPNGQYEIRIRAKNLPSNGSAGQTVTSVNAQANLFIVTPPEVLLPNRGIYDTTPEITWSVPPGSVSSTVSVTDGLTGDPVFVQSNITGNSAIATRTILNENGDPIQVPLLPGEYHVQVTTSSSGNPSVTSDPSTVHVFQIGSPPVPLGPSQGLGSAPFYQVVEERPTLTWRQSLAGETFSVWLTNATDQTVVKIAHDLEEASYTVEEDLPVGRYRYWVRADNGLGDQSAWSSSFVFDVKTRPVLETIQPTFDSRPTFTWNTPATGNLQPELDKYNVYIRRVDVTPVVNTETGFVVEGNSYTPSEDLPNGLYRIWVRGANETNASGRTIETIWSSGESFEISGRPIVTAPEASDDTTPVISWSPVGLASSYQLYVAPSNAAGSPLVNISGLTSTSFQISDPLPNGNYTAWVRSTSVTGQVSPWSVAAQGQFTITGSDVGAVGSVVISDIPSSNDRTPTFTWTPDPVADHYDIFVSSRTATNVALIRDTNVAGTTFTSTRPLAPGNYRVWVRAISADGQTGAWSTPVDFTILAANGQQNVDSDDGHIVMLASMEAVSAAMQTESVSVGLMQASVPNEISRAPEHVAVETSEKSPGAEAQETASSLKTDEDALMADWDTAIWAEESGPVSTAVAADLDVKDANDRESKVSTGWLTGLAMFSTSFIRRRQKKDDK